jgi:hypothetical protein
MARRIEACCYMCGEQPRNLLHHILDVHGNAAAREYAERLVDEINPKKRPKPKPQNEHSAP